MKSFRFSLETLLNLQNQRREVCRNKLSAINRRELELQQHVKSIGSEQETLRKYVGVQTEGAIIDVGLLTRCQMHLSQLEYQKNRTVMLLEEIRLEREGYLQNLVEAEQKVKVLEKLKEKQFREYSLRLDIQLRQEQEDNSMARLGRNRHL